MADNNRITSDLTQMFDEAWQVEEMFIIFNKIEGSKGVELSWGHLLTYEVLFEGPEIRGILSFKDTKNYLENLPLSVGGFIDISHVSQPKTKIGEPGKFNKKFVITGVKSSDGDQRGEEKVVELKFIDFVTKKLNSTYQTKVYDDMNPSESMGEHYKAAGVDNLIIAGNENEQKSSIITPSHINANEYLQEETKHRGYNFIQDRNSSYLVHESHMTNDKAQETGEIFEYKPANYSTRFQIIQYDTDGFDINALEQSVPSMTNSINDESTQHKEMDIKTQETSVSSGSIGGTSAGDFHTVTGQKQSTSYDQNSEQIMKDLKNLQSMSIWVPGWNGNRLGMTIQVELPRPTGIDQNASNEIYEGKWVVNSVRDKIISSYFIQELKISRAGG